MLSTRHDWKGFSRKWIYHIAWWATRSGCSNMFLGYFSSYTEMFLMLLKLSQLTIIFSSRGWKKKTSLTCLQFSVFSPFIGKTADSLKRVRNVVGELGKMVKLAGLFPVQFTLAASGPCDDHSLGGIIPVS